MSGRGLGEAGVPRVVVNAPVPMCPLRFWGSAQNFKLLCTYILNNNCLQMRVVT